MSLLRAGRALASSLSAELSELPRVLGSSFARGARVAHSSSEATPTVSVEEEVYNRHRNIMDLGTRTVDGRYTSYSVIDPGATVVGDVDISVRVCACSSSDRLSYGIESLPRGGLGGNRSAIVYQGSP